MVTSPDDFLEFSSRRGTAITVDRNEVLGSTCILNTSLESGLIYQGRIEFDLDSLDGLKLHIPLSPTNAIVRGTVKREDTLMAGIRVSMITSRDTFNTTCDATGSFHWSLTHPTQARLRIGEALNPEHASSFDIEIGEVYELNIDLSTASVFIELLAPDGSALQTPVTVALVPANVSEWARNDTRRLTKPDDLGMAQFTGVEPGDYLVNIGTESWFESRLADAGLSPVTRRIQVEDVDVSHTIQLLQASSIQIQAFTTVESGAREEVSVPFWITSIDGHPFSDPRRTGMTGPFGPAGGLVCQSGKVAITCGEWPHGFASVELEVAPGEIAQHRVELLDSSIETELILEGKGWSVIEKVLVFNAAGQRVGSFSTGNRAAPISVGFVSSDGEDAVELTSPARVEPRLCVPEEGTYLLVGYGHRAKPILIGEVLVESGEYQTLVHYEG